jgi:hypothetical protein
MSTRQTADLGDDVRGVSRPCAGGAAPRIGSALACATSQAGASTVLGTASLAVGCCAAGALVVTEAGGIVTGWMVRNSILPLRTSSPRTAEYTRDAERDQ